MSQRNGSDDLERLLEKLPHQPPMRLVERIVAVETRSVRARSACGTRHRLVLSGPFPRRAGRPRHRARGAHRTNRRNRRPRSRPNCASCVSAWRRSAVFKFAAPARPGATLDVSARVVGRMGKLVKIEGEVTADGVKVAHGSVTLAEQADDATATS